MAELNANATVAVDSDAPVVVLYCGGTFGMKPSPEGLTPSPNLEFTISELIAKTEGLPADFSWSYLQLDPSIDSADSTAATMLKLVARIRKVAAGARGVVVVHGTDTLSYAAATCALGLHDLQIPVVLTGSQRSIYEPNNDATDNFVDSLRNVIEGGPGVRVVFGSNVIDGSVAAKLSTEDFDGFEGQQPAVLVPIPEFTTDKLATLERFHDVDVYSRDVPQVGSITAFPGINARILTEMAHVYPDGFVLECYGSGNAPTSDIGVVESLQRASTSNTPVIAVTQCVKGEVTLGRYSTGKRLEQTGVVGGSYLTPSAAWAFLLIARAIGMDYRETLVAARGLQFDTVGASLEALRPGE